MGFSALIVGSGFGSRVVAGCYQEAGMEVEVVTPRNPAAVRAGIAKPFDLISIHSPPFLHAEHVNLALDHNHHVLCDKPFGVSAKEAQQMLDRAREKGVIHLLNVEFRCDPARKRVKEIIDSGEIGRVIHINWTFFNGFWRFPQREHGWLFDTAKGGGWLRSIGSHMIDTLRWMVGEIEEVVDVRGRMDVKERPGKDGRMHPGDTEDAFTAFLRTDTGATVSIDSASGASGTMPDHWTIMGTEGIIDITERIELFAKPLSRQTEIRIIGPGKQRVEHLGPFEGDTHMPAMRPWAKIVREAVSQRRQVAPSFEDGVAVSKVIERMLALMHAK